MILITDSRIPLLQINVYKIKINISGKESCANNGYNLSFDSTLISNKPQLLNIVQNYPKSAKYYTIKKHKSKQASN